MVALDIHNLYSKVKSNICPKTSYKCILSGKIHVVATELVTSHQSEQELSQKEFLVCFFSQACMLEESSWTLVTVGQLPVQQLSPVVRKSGHFVFLCLCTSLCLNRSSTIASLCKLAVMTNAVITMEISCFRKECHLYPDKETEELFRTVCRGRIKKSCFPSLSLFMKKVIES